MNDTEKEAAIKERDTQVKFADGNGERVAIVSVDRMLFLLDQEDQLTQLRVLFGRIFQS